jgi:hypothetical protein
MWCAAQNANNTRDQIDLYDGYQTLFDLYDRVFNPYSDEDITPYHQVAWNREIKVLSHQLIKAWHRKHGGHLIPRKVDGYCLVEYV